MRRNVNNLGVPKSTKPKFNRNFYGCSSGFFKCFLKGGGGGGGSTYIPGSYKINVSL